MGDLREEYQERLRRGSSVVAASLWHWGQAFAISAKIQLAELRRGGGWAGDARAAARQLVRQPGYSLVIIAAVALGIGVNAVLLVVADSVFLKPLPYPEAERLGIVSNDHTGSSTDDFGISFLNIGDARAVLYALSPAAAV